MNEMLIQRMSPLALWYMWRLIEIETKFGGKIWDGKPTRNRAKLEEYYFAMVKCGMGDDTDYWRKQYLHALRTHGFLFD